MPLQLLVQLLQACRRYVRKGLVAVHPRFVAHLLSFELLTRLVLASPRVVCMCFGGVSRRMHALCCIFHKYSFHFPSVLSLDHDHDHHRYSSVK